MNLLLICQYFLNLVPHPWLGWQGVEPNGIYVEVVSIINSNLLMTKTI